MLMVGCGSDDGDATPQTPAADSATQDVSVADSGSVAEDTSSPIDAPVEVASDAASDTRPEAGPVACTDAGGKVFTVNGHCYFPLPTTKTLVGAATECKTFGGAHIVTITSGEESDFIKNNIGTGEQWIGLTSKDPTAMKSDFDWLGGEAVTYDGWAAGSPASRGRCAVQLATGKWEDRPCSDLKIGVCERE